MKWVLQTESLHASPDAKDLLEHWTKCQLLVLILDELCRHFLELGRDITKNQFTIPHSSFLIPHSSIIFTTAKPYYLCYQPDALSSFYGFL
jgi:hypothetical protein